MQVQCPQCCHSFEHYITRERKSRKKKTECVQCKKEFLYYPKGGPRQRKKQIQRFCSRQCWYDYKRKPKSYKGGYVQIYVGKDFPGAKKNGRMFEHRYVMQQHLKRTLAPYEVVHHRNNIKNDNRIENLELVSPQLNTAYSLYDEHNSLKPER